MNRRKITLHHTSAEDYKKSFEELADDPNLLLAHNYAGKYYIITFYDRWYCGKLIEN
jgi:hypothetical protein